MSGAGYSGTPLSRKLGIRAGDRVGVFGAPRSFPDLLHPLPDGAVIVSRARRTCQVTVSFAESLEFLRRRFELARRLLPASGGLWVAWPKRASGVSTDIGFEGVQELGLSRGLVDNKVCAIDSAWSGLRFVVPVADRSSWSPER